MRKNLSKYIENTVYVLLLNLAVFVAWRAAVYWFEFQSPELFYLLLLVPALSVWYVFNNPNLQAEIRLSSLQNFAKTRKNWKVFLRPSWLLWRLFAVAALVLALARPQSKSSWQNINAEGIDIVISFDLSASMLAKDFRPNRLESAKSVAIDFINQRPNDRIGLVVYEGEAFTQCPLTTDHRVLKALFADVKTGMVDGGTAVGMGLATAVNRLRNSEAKSKVIILLTDGVNNAGSVPPITAAEIAKEYGIRVYTIGVGTRGKALSPVALGPNGQYQFDYVDVDIDEVSMNQIAKLTGGKYFRATNEKALKNIYSEIDRLEKTKLKVSEYSRRKEEFFWFAAAAVAFLLLEFLMRNTLFKSIP